MINSLPLFHRIAGQPVIVLGEGEAALAKRRLVERAGGIVDGEDNAEARLAFVALDDPEQAVARLKERGVLVNVPDRPDLCNFTVPSILDRSPVLLAIGTGGASAGLAKVLRLRLEQMLPPALGGLAAALGEARDEMRRRWAEAGERRRALDAALAEGGPLDPLGKGNAAAVSDWLGDVSSNNALKNTGASVGQVADIRLISDDPDDLTLGQARMLGTADVLAHEPDVPVAILDRARADAVRIAIGAGETVPERAGLSVVLRR
jgi:uroporphyrin-III C-methyltransferase/precorrin-2 dehydrogenase/sirohydrochlorin ferrochelatase